MSIPGPGRPPTDRKTDQTRAYADQVEKLQWLYKLKGISSAEFIGPLIEAPLNTAFETIRCLVEEIKKSTDVSSAGAK